MFDTDKNRPCFTMKVVSEQLDLHPQTIRGYERVGLIKPRRTKGNVRLFSPRDIEKLKKIISFRNMGINLPGIEVIMKLLKQIKELKEIKKRFQKQIKKEFQNNFLKTNQEKNEILHKF